MLKHKIENGEAIITDCDQGASGELVIPAAIEGKPVTKIGSWAFECCDSLKSVKIPDGVTTIGLGAFKYCKRLTSVTIGNGVTHIVEDAFYSCSALKDVYYDGSETDWSNISIGSYNAPLLNANIHFKKEEMRHDFSSK